MKVWRVSKYGEKPEDVGEFISESARFYCYQRPHYGKPTREAKTSDCFCLFLNEVEAWRHIRDRANDRVHDAERIVDKERSLWSYATLRMAELEKEHE